MRISIGVPAYNQGQYLAETLDSLLNQTVPPDEIVVSDNHSTDETPDVLRRYEGRVRVIRPPQHLPMTAHWNFLTRNLIGDWFSLLSSDDVALPNFVGDLLQGTALSPSAVLVRAGLDFVDPAGRCIGRRYILSVRPVVHRPDTLLEQLEGGKCFFTATLLRRDAWEAAGGFPERLHLLGDWGVWLRLAPLGDFTYRHAIVSRYRTAYPVERTRVRELQFLQDAATIQMEVIPAVASDIGQAGNPALLRASRRVLRTTLAHASQIIDREQRGEATSLLRAWAVSTDSVDILEAFCQGERIRGPRDWTGPLKRIVRKPAAVAYQWLR